MSLVLGMFVGAAILTIGIVIGFVWGVSETHNEE